LTDELPELRTIKYSPGVNVAERTALVTSVAANVVALVAEDGNTIRMTVAQAHKIGSLLVHRAAEMMAMVDPND